MCTLPLVRFLIKTLISIGQVDSVDWLILWIDQDYGQFDAMDRFIHLLHLHNWSRQLISWNKKYQQWVSRKVPFRWPQLIIYSTNNLIKWQIDHLGLVDKKIHFLLTAFCPLKWVTPPLGMFLAPSLNGILSVKVGGCIFKNWVNGGRLKTYFGLHLSSVNGIFGQIV